MPCSGQGSAGDRDLTTLLPCCPQIPQVRAVSKVASAKRLVVERPCSALGQSSHRAFRRLRQGTWVATNRSPQLAERQGICVATQAPDASLRERESLEAKDPRLGLC